MQKDAPMDTLRLWLIVALFGGTLLYTVAVMILQPI